MPRPAARSKSVLESIRLWQPRPRARSPPVRDIKCVVPGVRRIQNGLAAVSLVCASRLLAVAATCLRVKALSSGGSAVAGGGRW